MDPYVGALVLHQLLDQQEGQQQKNKKQGQQQEQPPVPGHGHKSWQPIWERMRVSVFWRGLPLMDGGVGKEMDCEQHHRDCILALFEEVAAANEKLEAGKASRHELFIVGADGRMCLLLLWRIFSFCRAHTNPIHTPTHTTQHTVGECCAKFAEPTWPRDPNQEPRGDGGSDMPRRRLPHTVPGPGERSRRRTGEHCMYVWFNSSHPVFPHNIDRCSSGCVGTHPSPTRMQRALSTAARCPGCSTTPLR